MNLLKRIFGNEISGDYEFEMEFSEEEKIIAKKVINILIYHHARKAYKTEEFALLEECLQH
jgi:hypothetical protein